VQAVRVSAARRMRPQLLGGGPGRVRACPVENLGASAGAGGEPEAKSARWRWRGACWRSKRQSWQPGVEGLTQAERGGEGSFEAKQQLEQEREALSGGLVRQKEQEIEDPKPVPGLAAVEGRIGAVAGALRQGAGVQMTRVEGRARGGAGAGRGAAGAGPGPGAAAWRDVAGGQGACEAPGSGRR